MKKISIFLALVLLVALSVPAAAEVEEITVGGSLQVRGQYLTPGFLNLSVIFPFAPSPTFIGFDDDIEDEYWVTQRTLLNVDAKLSGGVRAYAEIQAFDFWGLDFDDVDEEALSYNLSDPGGYGLFAGQGNDIIGLYQGYIEMNDIGDFPLQVRVGRQELVYGREWLIGNNNDGVNFSGLAFDALKVSYDTDMVRIDAWWSQLANFASPLTALTSIVEDDANIDFMGVYGTYKGFENTAIDGYFLWVRNPNDTQTLPAPTVFEPDFIEPNVGSDTDDLFTIGARIAGCWDMMGALPGMLDYNVEGAYQFGNANTVVDDGDYSAWALDIMGGYTFSETAWAPRIEGEYTFFSGDDDVEDNDVEQFSRLFSDVHYGELNLGGNLDTGATNLHIVRIGASVVPAEKLILKGDFYWFLLVEDQEFSNVFGQIQFGTDDKVGYELDLVADYQYTEDLNLRAGWAHFFADDAIQNSWGSGSDDDVDYLYVQALLLF